MVRMYFAHVNKDRVRPLWFCLLAAFNVEDEPELQDFYLNLNRINTDPWWAGNLSRLYLRPIIAGKGSSPPPLSSTSGDPECKMSRHGKRIGNSDSLDSSFRTLCHNGYKKEKIRKVGENFLHLRICIECAFKARIIMCITLQQYFYYAVFKMTFVMHALSSYITGSLNKFL